MQSLVDLIPLYVEITKDCPIGQIGPPFTYYHSDELKSNILARNLFEVDIKSAFPTICTLYFGKDHPFVKRIFELDDKLQRNIFIATTLKAQSELDNGKYLNELNLWSKIFAIGYTYSRYKNITILQYVKDGLIIKGELSDTITIEIASFLEYINNNNIIFHEEVIDYYLRFNKTTIMKYANDFTIKGHFRNVPTYIKDVVIPMIFNGDIYNSSKLSEIKLVYSDKFFQVILHSRLSQELNYYYNIGNNQYLDRFGSLSDISKTFPKMYLLDIIYPILALFRVNQQSL